MITRFAPSPTGPLHLGHAYSAILAHDMARANGGEFLLRIEDIDQSRARPEWEAQIYDDLAWLGLRWSTPVLRQSDRMHTYRDTLQSLWNQGYLYACSCSRRDIQEALSAPQEGAIATGPDGVIYPGTCKKKHAHSGPIPEGAALRLHTDRAMSALADHANSVGFQEVGDTAPGQVFVTAHDARDRIGDISLARADFCTSYHLSVVLDDAAQNITHVVRGADLFEATKIHVILQRLLGLPTPVYHHHHLIRDAAGKRLAKRDDARAISKYRADGASPTDVRRLVGL